MARISFNDISTGSGNEGYRVSFFSLKNDNDEAIVRIMHDSTDSFEIYNTHQIQIGNRYRRINCLRDPHDPIDVCPLCNSGTPIQQRIFVHMIQYVRDDSGNIVPRGVVWERSASFARDLKDKIDNYGPLSDCIFKIKRHGAAGYIKTTYSIDYFPAAMNNPTLYPKIDDMFDNYSALGSVVMDKSADEINVFINTGEFPANQPENRVVESVNEQNIPFIQSPVPTVQPTAPSTTATINDTPVTLNPVPTRPAPWATTTNQTVTRPNRYM